MDTQVQTRVLKTKIPMVLKASPEWTVDRIVMVLQDQHDELYERLTELEAEIQDTLRVYGAKNKELTALQDQIKNDPGMLEIKQDIKQMVKKRIFSKNHWEQTQQTQTDLLYQCLHCSPEQFQENSISASAPLLTYYEQCKSLGKQTLCEHQKTLENYTLHFVSFLQKHDKVTL